MSEDGIVCRRIKHATLEGLTGLVSLRSSQNTRENCYNRERLIACQRAAMIPKTHPNHAFIDLGRSVWPVDASAEDLIEVLSLIEALSYS